MISQALFVTWLAGFVAGLGFIAAGFERNRRDGRTKHVDRMTLAWAVVFSAIIAAAWPLILLTVVYVLFCERENS